jgi:gamma-glutamylputrescine oxidase
MISYWEREHFLSYDLIIIGGGIVGLSTAIHYQEKNPSHSILILERGLFPSGASSKNAGFACFGSLTELLDDLLIGSKEEVVALVAKRYNGIQKLRHAYGDEAIGYKATRGFELLTQKEANAVDQMDLVNEMLKPIFGQDVFSILDNFQKFPIGKEVVHIVQNLFEGEINSGILLNTLWQKCQRLNIKILTGALVEEIDVEKKQVFVNDNFNGKINFNANKLAICTNAFTHKFFPDLDIKPGRGLVMLIHPTKKIQWEGTFHFDRGYVYFRNVEGKILIGGGRNIDYDGETTMDFGVNEEIKNYLLKFLEEKLLMRAEDYIIEMIWSGIMAFGENKKPIVYSPYEGVGMAVRLGGMGVAIGYGVAEELVSLF